MKFNHIRHALEAQNQSANAANDNTVTIKGPLSNLYTEILHCLYKKSAAEPVPVSTDLTQYSQGPLVLSNESESNIRAAVENATGELLVIDTAMVKANSAISTTPAQTMVYAISPSGVTDTDLKAIVNEKIEADQNNYRFAIVAPDVIINQGVQTQKIDTLNTPDKTVTVKTDGTLLDGVEAASIALEMLSTKYGIEVISSREFIRDMIC